MKRSGSAELWISPPGVLISISDAANAASAPSNASASVSVAQLHVAAGLEWASDQASARATAMTAEAAVRSRAPLSGAVHAYCDDSQP